MAKRLDLASNEAGSLQKLPLVLFRCLGILLLSAAVCATVEVWCRFYLHLHDPIYVWPLRRELYPFPDLTQFHPRFLFLHSAQFFSYTGNSDIAVPDFMYPAPAVVLYRAFYAFWPHSVAAYLTFGVGALAVAGGLFARTLHRRGIGGLSALAMICAFLLLSYPIWFALCQGNIEIVVWVLLAGGTALLLKRHAYGAALCFAAAASLKLYPALFLALLLTRKEYKQFAFGAGATALFSLGSIEFVGPTFFEAYRGIEAGLMKFREEYVLQMLSETGFDHSMFGCFKKLVPFVLKHPVDLHRDLTIYTGLMALLVFALLFFKVWRMPTVNQISFATIVCLLCPPTSFEYTLLHALTLCGLLTLVMVDAERRGAVVPGLNFCLVACSLLLATLPEIIFHRQLVDGLIKCAALVSLGVAILRYPFRSRYDVDEEAA